MSVTDQLKKIYKNLSRTQKKIADYFIGANLEEISKPINSIAKITGVSIASISRFCKDLGFDNFQHFKISLSRDLKHDSERILPIFQKHDDPAITIKKVFEEAITNLQSTIGNIDYKSIVNSAQKISESDKVFLFGLGGSGGISKLGEILFTHIGIEARAITDPYEMVIAAGHSKKGTLIFGLSHSGRTKPVVESIIIGKKNKAFTIGITNYRNALLASNVDILLPTSSHERNLHFAQSDSMVAQLTILRTIYILIASREIDMLAKKLDTIESYVRNLIRVK